MLTVTDLPDDPAALKAMLIASEARNLRKDERIERLEKLVAAFRQAAFGRKSERRDPDQFDLALGIWKRPLRQFMLRRRQIAPTADEPLNDDQSIADPCQSIFPVSKRSLSRKA